MAIVSSTAGGESNEQSSALGTTPAAGAKEPEPQQKAVKAKGKMGNVFKKSVFRIVEKNELESYDSVG